MLGSQRLQLGAVCALARILSKFHKLFKIRRAQRQPALFGADYMLNFERKSKKR